LVPHFIWLTNNEFVTISYGLARTGLEQSSLINHIQYPLIFIGKQIGILIPFLILTWLLVQKIKFKINFKDKKLLFFFSTIDELANKAIEIGTRELTILNFFLKSSSEYNLNLIAYLQFYTSYPNLVFLQQAYLWS